MLELFPVMALDGLKSSHPISVEVNNPDEINDIFDRISYSKGAAVLRMIQNILSMDVFRRGLNKYLRRKMHQSADQDDLWDALTEESHKAGVLDLDVSIKEIMDTWTLQTGLPLVTAVRNKEDNSLILKQERFLISHNKTDKTYFWWIPVTYTDSSYQVETVWMNGETIMEIPNFNVSRNDWFLVNVNETGYYRVNYDLDNWNLLITQLQKPQGHLVFDIKNRAQLLNDAFNLASVGHTDYSVAMNVSKYLRQETEYLPWKTVFMNLDYIYEMFVRSQHFDKFKVSN